MAVTVDKTGAVGISVDGLGRHYVLKNLIDFSEDKLGSGETMGIMDLPADTQCREVWAKVLTADAKLDDIDIGIDGGDADGFHDGSSFASTGWKRDVSGESYSPPTGYIVTTDAVIAVKFNKDGDDKAVVEFYAECVDLNYNRVQ